MAANNAGILYGMLTGAGLGLLVQLACHTIGLETRRQRAHLLSEWLSPEQLKLLQRDSTVARYVTQLAHFRSVDVPAFKVLLGQIVSVMQLLSALRRMQLVELGSAAHAIAQHTLLFERAAKRLLDKLKVLPDGGPVTRVQQFEDIIEPLRVWLQGAASQCYAYV